MTLKEEITALQDRIAKTRSDRDTWRTSGMQEKYLESYSQLEALGLQLEELRQQGLRGFARAEPTGERERLMAQFSITFNGRHYQYDRYRYERFADAIAFARLQPSTPLQPPQAQDLVEAPDESQRQVMAELAITFQDGVYRLGEYRYDRLADAVNYARLLRLQGRRS